MGVSAGVMIAEDDDLLGAAQLLAVSGSHFGFWPGWAPSLLQVAGTPAAYSASASLSPSTIAMVSPAAMAASTSGRRYSTRESSRAQIARNTARRNRRPPFKGVEWHGRKWRARIFVDGRRIEIGTYPTPEEAPRGVRRGRTGSPRRVCQIERNDGPPEAVNSGQDAQAGRARITRCSAVRAPCGPFPGSAR